MRGIKGLLAILAACTGMAAGLPVATAASVSATAVTFMVHERSVPPYESRLLVTPAFLRFDDGVGSTSFILMDRQRHVIYSVDPERRNILVIHLRKVDIAPPFPLKLTEQDLGIMKDAPAIAGHAPRRYRLDANGESCEELVVAPGLLTDVVAALREYRAILAGDSATTFNRIPADMHDACDMAKDTFAADRYLRFGFPIQERRKDGYTRFLKDYDVDFQADPQLFVLPDGYERLDIQKLRGESIPVGQ